MACSQRRRRRDLVLAVTAAGNPLWPLNIFHLRNGWQVMELGREGEPGHIFGLHRPCGGRGWRSVTSGHSLDEVLGYFDCRGT